MAEPPKKERAPKVEKETRVLADGWDDYARSWQPDAFAVLPSHAVCHLGDEWTAEVVSENGTNYGIPQSAIDDVEGFLNRGLLDPYLPSRANQGLEIGPGGGRLTTLLIPRTKILHVADVSPSMLDHLRSRFGSLPGLQYHLMEGLNLPNLEPASLDYVIAFDVFVHFEPRLVFRYLQQIAQLLAPGGTGIIHYSNILTPIGWRQFEVNLESNVAERTEFHAFGVMCPEIMAKFLEALGLRLRANLDLIPRDAIAVFERPGRE